MQLAEQKYKDSLKAHVFSKDTSLKDFELFFSSIIGIIIICILAIYYFALIK